MYNKKDREIIIENKLIRFWYQARDGKAFFEKTRRHKYRHLIREVFFTKYHLDVEGVNNADAIFFISTPRPDLLEHFNSIYESCDLSKVLITTKIERHFHLTGLKAMLSCFSIFIANKDFYIDEYDDDANVIEAKKMVIPFWGRIYLWAFYSQIILMLKKVETHIYGKKIAVVLNDCMSDEALFVEMAKKLGITTVCCQEGMFCDNPNNKKDLPTMYLDQTSDYYILWGKYTQKLFLKYNKECYSFVCGDPFINKNESNVVEKWCCVCDVPPFHQINQEMIDIVTKVAVTKNKKVDIRLHPQERGRENSYSINHEICRFVHEDLRYEAVFTHTSTMFYIFSAQGIKAYRYLTAYSKVMPGSNEMEFTNTKELERLLLTEDETSNNVNEYVAYIAEDAKEKYRETFRKIILLHEERFKA